MSDYNKPKVNIHHAALHFAQQEGLDVDFICAELGLNKKFLLEKNETMNHDQIIKFWSMVNNNVNKERPGLEFAKNVRLTYVGLMGELFSKLESLEPLIPITCSVRNIITEMIHFEYTETDKHLTLHVISQGMWSKIDLESSLSACEYTMGNFYQIMNQLVANGIHPELVGIIPSQKSRIEYYEEYFKAPCVFGDKFFLKFKKSDLKQEISTQNKRLHEHYLELCKKQLIHETQGLSLKTHIENIIFYTRWPNIPSGEEMASYLFMSYKQLQRNLKKENVSYRDLINEIKAKYAKHMLSSGKFNATEISSILNYSDLSAFSRAFKEYNGANITTFLNSEAN